MKDHRSTPRLLITDLDNTLWDWFHAWYESFSGMLNRVTELSGVPREQLELEFRRIHRLRRTTEYSNLLNEAPSLIAAARPRTPAEAYDDAIHVLRSRRRASTSLYPGVRDTLDALRGSGVRVAAYTESVAFWTEWRIKHTGLDGIIDVLYSAEDHGLPSGMTVEDLRTGHLPPDSYGLKLTEHHHTPSGVLKPSAEVLLSILEDQGCDAASAVYIGDSLMKDIAMAQEAQVLDVHAKYGEAHARAEYELLRRVTHWSDADVEREQVLASRAGLVVPSLVCQNAFSEVLPTFGLKWEDSGCE